MMKLNLDAKTPGEEKVKAYLETNVSDAIADKINNGVFIEKEGKRMLNKKTLQGFISYATSEAQKTAESGAKGAFVDDDTVYGWAVHYFEEDGIIGVLYNEDGSEYKPVTKTKTSGKSANTPTFKSAVKKVEPQISLFDIVENDSSINETDVEPSSDKLDEAFENIADKETEVKKPKQQQKGSLLYEKYKEIALKYPDGIVCFKIGDFYEILGRKAQVAANCLMLTLTSRDCGLKKSLPMCGFPYHCADNYMSKLVSAGYKVVIVETFPNDKQVERVLDKVAPKDNPKIDMETGEIVGSDDISSDLLNLFNNNIIEV